MEIPVVSLATQIFGICETEPSPLISALFSISAKTLYFAARNSPLPPISSFPVSPSFSCYIGDPQTFRGCKLQGEFRRSFSTVNTRDGAHSMLPFVFRDGDCTTGCLFIRELFVRSRVNYSTKISRRQWSQNYKELKSLGETGLKDSEK